MPNNPIPAVLVIHERPRLLFFRRICQEGGNRSEQERTSEQAGLCGEKNGWKKQRGVGEKKRPGKMLSEHTTPARNLVIFP